MPLEYLFFAIAKQLHVNSIDIYFLYKYKYIK